MKFSTPGSRLSKLFAVNIILALIVVESSPIIYAQTLEQQSDVFQSQDVQSLESAVVLPPSETEQQPVTHQETPSESSPVPEQSVSETEDSSESQELQQESLEGFDSLMSLSSFEDMYRDRSNDTVKPNVSIGKGNGSLVYSYPIIVPPGRNDITTPHLSLSYSSNNTDTASVFGHGWSIDIPYIERIYKKGSQNFFTGNTFYSSFSGELATTSATTTFAAKVETGDFLTYTFNNNFWTVTDMQGTQYFFGTSTTGRISDPSDSTKISKWMLQEIRDVNNNYVWFDYYKHEGQLYPESISYTWNQYSWDGKLFSITFERESRPDPLISTRYGFPISTSYRISRINVNTRPAWNGPENWYRRYTLGYGTGNNGTRSIITTITESSRDESFVESTLAPTRFTYSTSTPGYATSTSYAPPLTFIHTYNKGTENDPYNLNVGVGTHALDVNGDGLTDIMQGFAYDDNQKIRRTFINNGNGYTEDTNWAPPTYFAIRDADTTTYHDLGVQFDDVTGDGLVDIIASFQYQYREGFPTP